MTATMIYRYICLSARNIGKLRTIVRNNKTLSEAEREEISKGLLDAQDLRPVIDEQKPKKKETVLPWLQILNTYLARYGIAQTSLMLNMSERVLRCITEGACVPSEKLQKQICVLYTKDSNQSYVEVVNGKA